jgi:hypothetical protein
MLGGFATRGRAAGAVHHVQARRAGARVRHPAQRRAAAPAGGAWPHSPPELPVLVVGRGSNLLVADDGFAGIAISLASDGRVGRVPRHCRARRRRGRAAGAGSSLRIGAGLTGFEWAVGVPGSVGGAVRMNAGGHGSDMAACLLGVHVLDLRIRATPAGWVPQNSACTSAAPTSRITRWCSTRVFSCSTATPTKQPPTQRDRPLAPGDTSPVVRTPARCSSTRSPASFPLRS